MGQPLYIKLLTKWHDDPDWRSQSMEERLTFLYFLSLVEWSGDGCERGVVEYTRDQLAAREGVSTDKVKDWVKRWERLGTIERLPAGRRGYTNYSRARVVKFDDLYSTTTQARSASPVVSPVNHPVVSPVVSPVEVEETRGFAEHAHPVKSPVVSPVNHPVVSPITSITRGSERLREEETRASALPPSLPRLDSPEGVDGRQTDPSPTPPATAPTALSVGAVPGAVDLVVCPERLTYAAVRDLWAETWRMRYEHGMPTGLGGRSCPVTRLLTTMQRDATTKPLADVWEGVATVLEAFVYDDDDWLRSRQHPLAYALKHWAKYDRPRAMTKLQEALTVGAHVEEREVDQPVEAVAQASPPEPVTLQTYRRATGDDADDARELLRQLVDEGLPDIDGGTLCADGDDLVLVFADELAAMVAERRLTRYVDGLRCAHGEVVR
jgi:hypothetical protein